MSRKENYFLPIKNYFSEEFLRQILREFLQSESQGTVFKSISHRDVNKDADIFGYQDDMALEYLNMYGARSFYVMKTIKLNKHTDTYAQKQNFAHASRGRRCVLNMPLNDHTKYGDLHFYDDWDDVEPVCSVNYSGNALRPYLLNIEKIHEVDRSDYPSLTLQLEYESYNKAKKILSDKRLIDSSYHP